MKHKLRTADRPSNTKNGTRQLDASKRLDATGTVADNAGAPRTAPRREALPSGRAGSGLPLPVASNPRRDTPIAIRERMQHRAQTTRKPVRRSTKQGDETRSRILDVAEKLFSERGYDTTTIRDVTAAARVQTGQFIHYFGQKEQLLREVIHRRSGEHIAAVKQNIELARKKNPRGPARPRDIIEAYIQIVAYKFSQPDEGWHRYIRLLALCTKSHTLRGLLDAYVKFIEPLNEEFLTELRKACSYASDNKIRLAYYFVECTLIDIILDTHTLRRRSEGEFTPSDISEFMDDLVNYMTAGFLRVIED